MTIYKCLACGVTFLALKQYKDGQCPHCDSCNITREAAEEHGRALASLTARGEV